MSAHDFREFQRVKVKPTKGSFYHELPPKVYGYCHLCGTVRLHCEGTLDKAKYLVMGYMTWTNMPPPCAPLPVLPETMRPSRHGRAK